MEGASGPKINLTCKAKSEYVGEEDVENAFLYQTIAVVINWPTS